MKLYCFSYAGGSAMTYAKWKTLAHKSLEVIPFEIPGRGTRFSEELCTDMEELVDDIYGNLKDEFNRGDYMLFGHSMGSLIAYHLAKKIAEADTTPPVHLFVSGKEAPHLRKSEISCQNMSEKEFIEYVYDFGGTPKELLENEDFLNIFLPILKSDFLLIEKCKPENAKKYFDFGITAFYGREDDIEEENIWEWERYTTGEFSAYPFQGGHFFLHNYTEDILSIIYKESKRSRICLKAVK